MPKRYTILDIRRSDEEQVIVKKGILGIKRKLNLTRSRATINQYIGTLVVHLLIVITLKHVLVPHHAYSFFANAQPIFSATAVSIRVKYINRIVPATCGLAVVVDHPIQLVVCPLHGFPGNGCHDFWNNRAARDS
jgi:hypothetical protein